MGFFSNDCHGCGHPLLSEWSATPINVWMVRAVTVTPDGVRHGPGDYDGYGRLADGDVVIEAHNAFGHATCWHEACWEIAGSPSDYRGASPDSPDQGYFFDGEHDVPNPWGGAA